MTVGVKSVKNNIAKNVHHQQSVQHVIYIPAMNVMQRSNVNPQEIVLGVSVVLALRKIHVHGVVFVVHVLVQQDECVKQMVA